LPLYAQFQTDHFVPFKYQLDDQFTSVRKKQVRQEVAEIVEMQQDLNDADLREMNYWNATYPSYRWHQILMEISQAHRGHKNGGRMAILHLAIYDALLAV